MSGPRVSRHEASAPLPRSSTSSSMPRTFSRRIEGKQRSRAPRVASPRWSPGSGRRRAGSASASGRRRRRGARGRRTGRGRRVRDAHPARRGSLAGSRGGPPATRERQPRRESLVSRERREEKRAEHEHRPRYRNRRLDRLDLLGRLGGASSASSSSPPKIRRASLDGASAYARSSIGLRRSPRRSGRATARHPAQFRGRSRAGSTRPRSRRARSMSLAS